QRRLDFARRHRAEVAETLCDDEVRIQPAQQGLVDPVQAAPVLECVPDLPVDGRTGGLLRVHGTSDDHGLVPDFRGVVAFVADGHEVVHQAEGGHDVRGPGEQGADAHGQLQNRRSRALRSYPFSVDATASAPASWSAGKVVETARQRIPAAWAAWMPAMVSSMTRQSDAWTATRRFRACKACRYTSGSGFPSRMSSAAVMCSKLDRSPTRSSMSSISWRSAPDTIARRRLPAARLRKFSMPG